MNRSSWSYPVSGWVVAALLSGAVLAQPGGPVAAQPTPVRADAPLPAELRYVPADAALFLHADAHALWTGELAKSFRTANKDLFDRAENAGKAFGGSPKDLKAVALFVPKIKGPGDDERLGIVLTFDKPLDKDKFTTAVKGLFPDDAKVKVLTPSDTLAVVLVGLGVEYAKPQPAGADGPLTAAIRAASSGKHMLVAGATLANLSDELQKDDLPAQLRPLQPILKAEAITATVTLGATLDLAVRVRTKREALAGDAEKALALLVRLIADECDRTISNAEKEAGMKDVVTVFKAGLAATKGAKLSVDGTEARLSASLPLGDLPLAPAYRAVGTRVTAAPSPKSANNLKQIGLAMHAYHDANNSFPAAAICDKKGKPLLSWRVAVLPYLEQADVYEQFKLDEPWDSEHNKKLLANMPSTYALPGSKPGSTETHYRAFVGNGAAFDWAKGHKILDISDGASNTLMVATAAHGVPWTKPDELEFDPQKDMSALITLVGGRAQMVMCDGSIRTLKKLPSKETLNALITKDGNEIIGNDF
ncbi:DUF1559 family PulG-like putative transporter [Frigoriglobus tundricola]|uniref:DUF1559 domain-containing protein n=1 Tax=Frigoriglobus tundricola TaxID=2774151 RepID=A0A6M5YHF6_9BACT|nr:DUF1559 domain-containing protein [Frigoriglobus tundricola]QJW92693.1 hypothetical protein FTUN_0190 [Frigoriglobus tundricola]